MMQSYFTLPVVDSPTIEYHYSNYEQRFGALIERAMVGELTRQGYHVRLLPDFSASYDLIVNDSLPIEVKAAKPTVQHNHRSGPRERWQFCLQSKLDQDYLFILVCVDSDGVLWPYVVPSAYVGNRQMINVTSHPERFSGWLSPFLEDWNQVDTVSTWRQRFNQSAYGQLSLFDQGVNRD